MTLSMQVFAFVVLIISVIIHEVAHGYAAKALGDPTAKLAGRLTLNPIKHIDLWGSILVPAVLVLTHSGILFGWAKPVPYNPYNLKNQRFGETIVSVAGVATNLLLAVLFGLIARFALASGFTTFAALASLITLINLSLGLFNLIPIPPLDGYTVVRSALPYTLSQKFLAIEERLRAGGILTLIAVLFLFSYFLSGPFSLLVEYCFHLLVGI